MSRLTLDLDSSVDTLLSDLATKKDQSKPEIIRRALALYAYLHKEIDPRIWPNGALVQVAITVDGKIKKTIEKLP